MLSLFPNAILIFKKLSYSQVPQPMFWIEIGNLSLSRGGFFCIIVSVDILSMAKHMQPRWDGTQLKIQTMKPRWKNDQELLLKTYLTISEGGWGTGSKFVKVNAQTKWTCASTCNNATTNVRHLYMHMPIHAHRISPTKSSWTSPFLHRLIVPLSKI